MKGDVKRKDYPAQRKTSRTNQEQGLVARILRRRKLLLHSLEVFFTHYNDALPNNTHISYFTQKQAETLIYRKIVVCILPDG